MPSNHQVRVAFVGAGRISTLHQLHYASNPDAKLVAICDKNKGHATERTDAWGISKENVYTDLDQMLKRDDIDAIEVLTPHSTHAKIVIAACEAGKHVSVQKVPCMSLSEFDAMQAAARKAGVKLKVFENFQFHPPYVRALQVIKSEGLGDVIAANIRFWNTAEGLSSWNVPLMAWKWRISEKDNFKLPTLFDDGYHKHNIVHLFLNKNIESVQAWKRQFHIYKVVPVDAPALVSYKTKGIEYGTWNVSMSQKLPIRSDYYGCEEQLELHCEHGLVWINGCTGNMFAGCEKGPGEPGVYWLDPKGTWHHDCSMQTNWKYSFMECTRDFIDAIKQDRPPYRSGKEARHVLQVDLAMVASLRSGSCDFKVARITDGLPRGLAEAEMPDSGGDATGGE